MKLESLTRLLAGANPSQSAQQQEATDQQSAEAAAQNSEAVKLAQDFGSASPEYNPEVRRQKVEELKSQVANGTYYRDSKSVAAALARELFY
ncbi:MAG: flagellar biosynthesis anti-sigma factor FlgM [Deltaproteobacteria bacterium]|nr:flagellar biosynthesis anti-sigma factor FlgM [Deltaproteobacteria bacterium]